MSRSDEGAVPTGARTKKRVGSILSDFGSPAKKKRVCSILSDSGSPMVGKEDPIFALLGDMAHYASLIFALAFAYALTTYATRDSDNFFDQEWKKDGCCIANRNVPYLNTHDVCLYFDVVASLVLLLLLKTLGNRRGMTMGNELMGITTVGLMALAVEHALMGMSIRNEYQDDDPLTSRWSGANTSRNTETVAIAEATTMLTRLQQQSMLEILTWQIPVHFFWGGLIKLSMTGLSNIEVGIVSTTALLAHLTVPVQFGFIYVQALLVVAVSFYQLSSREDNEKDFVYATYPLLVLAPTILMAWLESTQCTDFVRDKLYGRLLYDAYLAGSVLTWYMLCYLHVCGSVAMSKSIKKVEFDFATVGS